MAREGRVVVDERAASADWMDSAAGASGSAERLNMWAEEQRRARWVPSRGGRVDVWVEGSGIYTRCWATMGNPGCEKREPKRAEKIFGAGEGRCSERRAGVGTGCSRKVSAKSASEKTRGFTRGFTRGLAGGLMGSTLQRKIDRNHCASQKNKLPKATTGPITEFLEWERKGNYNKVELNVGDDELGCIEAKWCWALHGNSSTNPRMRKKNNEIKNEQKSRAQRWRRQRGGTDKVVGDKNRLLEATPDSEALNDPAGDLVAPVELFPLVWERAPETVVLGIDWERLLDCALCGPQGTHRTPSWPFGFYSDCPPRMTGTKSLSLWPFRSTLNNSEELDNMFAGQHV
ncbi:hypothetical protein B0H14DRAFT_2557426 [Mycena olivaceomarginata]|nr:hypothetical protein B0H14DRAFT_2557426 [Mycena olivaceomarginata]